MTRPPALVVVNPAARKGTAWRRYERVRPTLEQRLDTTTTEMTASGAWTGAVGQALAEGVRLFVAVGGDGTVHALVNALACQRGALSLSDLALGAVGVGSSNDFHKPYRDLVAGVPVRIDGRRTTPRDVVRARYCDHVGRERSRLFLISASIGLVATANGFFNRGDRILRRLDRIWPQLAIVYAALRTLASYRNLPAEITLPSGPERMALTNASVLKTPYLSGSFRYDTPVPSDDGLVTVNLCHGLDRLSTLRMFLDLARGRFEGRPGTHHWRSKAIEIRLDSDADLELDGEVVQASHIRFDVTGERILLCS